MAKIMNFKLKLLQKYNKKNRAKTTPTQFPTKTYLLYLFIFLYVCLTDL